MINKIRAHANPVIVCAHDAGTAEDVERFSRRTVKVTREHNEECRRLLKLMGIPVVIVRSYHISRVECTSDSFHRHRQKLRPNARNLPAERWALSFFFQNNPLDEATRRIIGVRGGIGGHGYAHVQRTHSLPPPHVLRGEKGTNKRDQPEGRARGT